MDTLLVNGSSWDAAIYLLASNLPKRRIEIQPRAKSSKRKIKENSANSFPSTQAVFHCLSEIHAKVTIFQAGSKVYWSKVRTFCMFYSVFRHITHKSLPLLLGEQQTEFCFQQIFETYQKTGQGQWWLLHFRWSLYFVFSSQHWVPQVLTTCQICWRDSQLHLNYKLFLEFLFMNCIFCTNVFVWNTWVWNIFWIILSHIP